MSGSWVEKSETETVKQELSNIAWVKMSSSFLLFLFTPFSFLVLSLFGLVRGSTFAGLSQVFFLPSFLLFFLWSKKQTVRGTALLEC